MEIINSTIDDLDVIFNFYDMAVAFQKTKFDKHWQAFDRELVKNEIKERRQWKIIIDDTVACIFAITYSDKNIWGDRDKDPAMYIHRIVTHSTYRGNNFVIEIINWARIHAKEKNKKFIRLDTWGDNQKLREHYTKCGFNFLGVITPTNTSELPKHYSAITLSLFEIALH
ncbi:MAG: GNAT family N-acetyltransferase [Bacteroidia bacterium]